MVAHKFLRSLVSINAFATLLMAIAWPSDAKADHAGFKEEVFPIITFYCSECHTPPDGAGFKASGFDTTSYEKIMKGTKHGSIITPGDAFASNLMVLIEGRASKRLKMPHNGEELSRWEKTILRRWINHGAKND